MSGWGLRGLPVGLLWQKLKPKAGRRAAGRLGTAPRDGLQTARAVPASRAQR